LFDVATTVLKESQTNYKLQKENTKEIGNFSFGLLLETF